MFRTQKKLHVPLMVSGVLIDLALVLILELVNTALERVMDILKPRVHPYARVVKDVMAGAVFIASCGAFIVGVIIFTPYMFR
ncbi:MAG: diacylglycerol kinase [Candidatus Moranbacteria bacterium]|nr:diacylglycerol kinase [Candidatus Moranbacteria bacterium]